MIMMLVDRQELYNWIEGEEEELSALLAFWGRTLSSIHF